MNEPSTVTDTVPELPRHTAPTTDPSFFDCLTRLMYDPGAVIPASIYTDWSYKVPVPQGPLVISQPDAIEKVLFDTGNVFGRNRQTQTLMRRGWGDELAAATGEKWLMQRRAAAPAFRAKSVAQQIPKMTDIARAADWEDRPVELSFDIGRIVSEIVLKTLITGSGKLDYDAVSRDLPVHMRQITQFGLADFMPVPEAFLDFLRGLPKSGERQRLRKLADDIAEQRADGPDEIEDVLTLVRGKSNLSDIIFGFMGAGVETTSMAAAWAVYMLALHPKWQARIRREGLEAAHEPGTQDIARTLPLTAQIVREALRLYPPAPILVRTAEKRNEVLGHTVKPGQAVIVDVHALHRHQSLWDDPDAFRPERFGSDAPKRHRAAFIPFGAGPRMCLAMNFALTEITVIVSELVRAYEISPADPAPEVSLHISTHSETGLNVTARRI